MKRNCVRSIEKKSFVILVQFERENFNTVFEQFCSIDRTKYFFKFFIYLNSFGNEKKFVRSIEQNIYLFDQSNKMLIFLVQIEREISNTVFEHFCSIDRTKCFFLNYI
jgi:hypothetical protein